MLDLLLEREADLETLRGLIVDDSYSVASKDGYYGLLLEVEFVCDDSEETRVGESPLPYELRASQLIPIINRLTAKYPQVLFAVPARQVVFKGRPAIWAFVPMAEAVDMGTALLEAIAFEMSWGNLGQ